MMTTMPLAVLNAELPILLWPSFTGVPRKCSMVAPVFPCQLLRRPCHWLFAMSLSPSPHINEEEKEDPHMHIQTNEGPLLITHAVSNYAP